MVNARRSRDCLFFYSSKQPMPRVFLVSSNVPGTPVLELRMVLVKLCVSVFFQGEECGSSLAKPATMSTEINARGPLRLLGSGISEAAVPVFKGAGGRSDATITKQYNYNNNEDNEASSGPHDTAPAKRLRWATQRVAGSQGGTKRQSILRRLSHKKRTSDDSAKRESNGTDLESVPEGSEASADQSGPGRRVFFNMPLPEDARDEEGHPNTQFVRNKIRTAKYTPISFIPKNLWFQFHNIANIYFLFIIILSIFPIFGATNPGLSAVPLIVIVFITAVKDGIEDWRRTVLDNELNNAPAHRLVDWENVNTAEDQISLWRKFKKANTRAITSVWRLWKNRKEPKDEKRKSQTDRALDEGRPSTDTRRPSMYSQRMSAMSIATEEPGAMEMTPVHSPMPAPAMEGNKEMDFGDHVRTSLENDASKPGDARQVVEVAKDPTESNAPIPKRFYGNVINPNKPAGKARFKKDCWKNVQVGDFVRLYNEESIPADIVVLSTSDPDGACYVETKNLDGETNLKVRQALHCSQKVKRARDCERAEFILESEPPHANLYSYSGAIRWKQQGSKNSEVQAAEMAEPVSINNMLLRGCSIRNTEWVLGIVVFTGEETKIMLNSGITPTKRAQISKDLNWNVIYNFIILFFMCLISALVQGTTWGKGNESLDFFEFGSYGGTPGLNGFITFWAAIILFQNLVPISLYISLEIVRTAQAFFIYSDTFMYYAPVDYPCTPKSWNISDDLGQIEYIFSDKTGTLTQNVMEFKKVTINGVPYGEAYTEALAGMQKRQGIDTDVEGAKAREQIARGKVKMLEDLRKIHNNPYLLDENVTFVAPDYISDLTGASGPQQKAANEYFMLVLALCHTVITERTPGDPPKLEFKAQSPDEAALVATARDCGFTTGSDEELKAAKKNHEPPAPTHAVVVDGETLKLMLDDKLRQKFLLLCKECKSVLCCRVSPSQKAAVVGMVKNGLDVMTLSIGDGANDVAMIQKAHVGVGIAGEEGRQAVMSSDYAIGQFRFLTRLVLNIIWTFALFWYQIFANFDCSYIFDYSYILLYNLAFTSLPVILMGILDQDVDDKVSLAVPQLYRRGIERKEWTQIKFWTYMIDGLYQSLVCFFLPYLLFRPANFNTESGQNVNDYQRIGVYIANATVVVANVYILMNTYRWDWFFTLITTISILLIWTWTGIYSSFTVGFTFYKAGAEAYGSLSFWALTMMVIIVALLPRFAAKSFQKIFMPRDIDVIREQIRQGKFDYLKNVNPDGPNGVTPSPPEKGSDSTSSSEISKPSGAQRLAHKLSHNRMPTEDERPIYPPSIAATATTRNARSHNGSDGTDYTGHRSSIERTFPAVGQVTSRPSEDFGHSPIDFYRPPVIAGGFESPAPRPSYDRPRPSFDRLRASMDFERTRPSFESSRDFTSAAYLSRVESSHTPAGTPGVHEDRKDIGYAM
ncbi:phospholipid-translocating P-type ATPase [Aureobasidium pullulans]|nr:phospholipid-translocating P-type ATPase [Aureobasidium pullulans]